MPKDLRGLEEHLIHLEQQHDAHMKIAYDALADGQEVDILWAYGAGLHHALRTIQDGLRDGLI